jgi:lipopolysaccharide transport system permease protein
MTDLVVIESGREWSQYWRALWRYRELFVVFAWRDLSVRYKQTVIGVAWALIGPLLTVLILTIVFGRIANLPSEGEAPYALMVYAGMLPWTFFSTGLANASNSLVSNANLIGKVYFPRIIVPTATIVVSLADFIVSFCMLLALMVWYRFQVGWHIVLLPIFFFLGLLATLGPALWISALSVKYRDFRYVIPLVLQLGLYASPVGFSSNVVPEQWRLFYSLNPMVSVIDGFRWCLLAGQSQVYLPGLALGLGVISLFLLFGLTRFRATEDSLADVI